MDVIVPYQEPLALEGFLYGLGNLRDDYRDFVKYTLRQ